MKQSQFNGPLVEVNWLKRHLFDEDLIILDATLPKATGTEEQVELDMRIPTARFFDIEKAFSDITSPFPNTWPGEKAFCDAARKLGIDNESYLVVYDDHGIYSSARAWWMFKAMGHQHIAVLNGGRKAWIEAGYDLEFKTPQELFTGNFEGTYDPGFFRDYQSLFKNLKDQKELVVDARAANRFQGLVDEPRKGLRSGHIPGSVNLPYTNLLSNGKMRSEDQLKHLIEATNPEQRELVFSCGSGITACVLALGAELAGYNKVSVYDGSWTEWGSLPELPVEKNA